MSEVKKSSKLTVKMNIQDIKAEDILCFVEKNSKSENDKINKIREKIIACICNEEMSIYLKDEKYGELWTSIKTKLESKLRNLCEEEYYNFSIQSKGTMKYNYDFVVSYFNGDTLVTNKKIEFKHNVSNVKDLPQILELYDKDCKNKYKIFDYSYSEYYYDKYIDKYIELMGEDMNVEKPSKEVYLKNVHKTTYKSKHKELTESNSTPNIFIFSTFISSI